MKVIENFTVPTPRADLAEAVARIRKLAERLAGTDCEWDSLKPRFIAQIIENTLDGTPFAEEERPGPQTGTLRASPATDRGDEPKPSCMDESHRRTCLRRHIPEAACSCTTKEVRP